MAVSPHLLEQLLAVPPREFTRARNALAASLQKDGHAADAREVRRLRRPSVGLWVTNQLARAEPRGLGAFLDAVAVARRTLLRDPRTAGDAVQRHRAELDALLERARALLVAQGAAVTPAALQRIAHTLLGAAVDQRRAQDLRRGRLTEELPAPGFEVFAGAARPGHLRLVSSRAPVGAGGREVELPRSAAGASARAHDGERRAQAAQRRTHEAEQRRAREAEQRARVEQARERRRQEAEERARDASERRALADELARQVDELTAKLTAARRQLRDAQRAARAAAAASRAARRRTRP
jgi:hypothetical protein